MSHIASVKRILDYVQTEYGKTWVLQDPNVKAMTRILLQRIMKVITKELKELEELEE